MHGATIKVIQDCSCATETLETAAANSLQTMITIYQSTRRYIPEDLNFIDATVIISNIVKT